MLSMVAQNVITITDTIFLGHLGEVELGAAALGGLLYTAIFMLGFGFTMGVQILVARRAGENNPVAIGRIFDNSFYFVILIGVAITFILYVFTPVVFKLIISSPQVFEAGNTFLRVRIFGFTFALVALLFRSFYTGIAYTKYLSYSSILMALINVILNYTLIFGNFGFPRMGIQGSALASVISEGFAMIFFLVVTIGSKRVKTYQLFRMLRPDLKVIRHTLGLSVFIMFQYLVSLGGWFIFFIFIEKLGQRELAASNIIRSLYLALMIPAWALSATVNTLVSNALGQGKPEMVLPVIRKVGILSMFIVGCILIVGVVFAKQIISIYTKDSLLIDATIPIFYVISGAIFLFSFATILFNGVLGTANTNMGFFIEFVTIVLYILAAWLMAIRFHLPVHIVWMAEYVYMIIMGGLSFIYLETGKWKGKRI